MTCYIPFNQKPIRCPYHFNFAKEVVNLYKKSHSSEVDFASFYVTSLFTNIPVLETIDIIIDRLFQDKD